MHVFIKPLLLHGSGICGDEENERMEELEVMTQKQFFHANRAGEHKNTQKQGKRA